MFATALLAYTSIQGVILFDLGTFIVAFVTLFFFIRIPQPAREDTHKEAPLHAALEGLRYLKANLGILHLILFLAVINFTASVFNTALPAMMLSRQGAGESALALVNTFQALRHWLEASSSPSCRHPKAGCASSAIPCFWP